MARKASLATQNAWTRYYGGEVAGRSGTGWFGTQPILSNVTKGIQSKAAEIGAYDPQAASQMLALSKVVQASEAQYNSGLFHWSRGYSALGDIYDIEQAARAGKLTRDAEASRSAAQSELKRTQASAAALAEQNRKARAAREAQAAENARLAAQAQAQRVFNTNQADLARTNLRSDDPGVNPVAGQDIGGVEFAPGGLASKVIGGGAAQVNMAAGALDENRRKKRGLSTSLGINV